MKILNNHHYFRYLKFIESRPRRSKPNKKFSGLELHHIIPSSLGGTNDPKNLIYLTAREHYLVHWWLAKALGGGMWFAFNQMRRVIPGEVKTSRLHELARKYISEQCSLVNTGRPMSAENREMVSKRMKGKLWVKNINDEDDVLLMSNKDDRYLLGQYVQVHTGCSRSAQARQNLSDANGTRGKVPFYSKKNLVVKYFDKDVDPGQKYIKGMPPGFSERMSKITENLIFYYDPITLKQVRLKPGINPPSGFIKGRIRGADSGLSKMNDPNTFKIFDLHQKKRIVIQKKDFNQYPFGTLSSNNAYLVIFHNFIFESKDCFTKLNQDFPKLLIKNENLVKYSFIPHPNMRKEKYEFCLKYKNLTFEDLNIRICRVDMFFDDVEGKIFIRRDDGIKNDEFRRAFVEERRTSESNRCFE